MKVETIKYAAVFTFILLVVLLMSACQTVPNMGTTVPKMGTSIHKPGGMTEIIQGCGELSDMLAVVEANRTKTDLTGEQVPSCWKSAEQTPIPAILVELISGPYPNAEYGPFCIWQVLDATGDVSFTTIPERMDKPASMPEPEYKDRRRADQRYA